MTTFSEILYGNPRNEQRLAAFHSDLNVRNKPFHFNNKPCPVAFPTLQLQILPPAAVIYDLLTMMGKDGRRYGKSGYSGLKMYKTWLRSW